MRRVRPWLATALLVVVAGAAGVVGVLGLPRQSAAAWVTKLPSRSPSAWVSRVLAATQAAGTARLSGVVTEQFSYASSPRTKSTSSTLSRLRAIKFEISGAIDFTTHRLETDAVDRGHLFKHEVEIGRTLFTTRTVGRPQHVKGHIAVGPLGTLAYEEPFTSYDPLATPSATVRVKALGTGTVGGIDVLAYQLVSRSCDPPVPLPVVDVWVDHLGRLVQIRTALRATAPPSKEPSGYPPEPVEHVSLVETFTLSDFGNPMTIRQTVPAAQFSSPGPTTLPKSPHCQG